ncbi:hypothetical protein LCGC14_2164490, partial [marine sediment metagenome]
IDVLYGVHYVQYPIKSLISKLLKKLGYKIEYNKPEEDLFKLKKIKEVKKWIYQKYIMKN